MTKIKHKIKNTKYAKTKYTKSKSKITKSKIINNLHKKISKKINKLYFANKNFKNKQSKKTEKEEVNKIIDNFILNLFSPKESKFSLLEKQERYAAFNLGKGYGVSSIKEEVDNCLYLIKNKPYIFIDIGANKGEYSKEILNRFPDIEIYMFEPSNFHKKNLENLFGSNPNIHINNIALSNITGKQILYSDKYGSPLASLTKRNLNHLNIDFEYKEEIETKRFDEYWKTTNNFNNIIDYVKIDVEGNELKVLEGIGEFIKKIRLIQFEFGGSNVDTRTYFRDFWNYFNEYSFSIYRITPQGLLFISKYWEMDEVFLVTNYIAINKYF